MENRSGKTTLLNALGGRLSGDLSGQISYSRRPLNRTIRKRIGYILQQDILLGNLSVYETLWCTARLRLGDQPAAVQDKAVSSLTRSQNGFRAVDPFFSSLIFLLLSSPLSCSQYSSDRRCDSTTWSWSCPGLANRYSFLTRGWYTFFFLLSWFLSPYFGWLLSCIECIIVSFMMMHSSRSPFYFLSHMHFFFPPSTADTSSPLACVVEWWRKETSQHWQWITLKSKYEFAQSLLVRFLFVFCSFLGKMTRKKMVEFLWNYMSCIFSPVFVFIDFALNLSFLGHSLKWTAACNFDHVILALILLDEPTSGIFPPSIWFFSSSSTSRVSNLLYIWLKVTFLSFFTIFVWILGLDSSTAYSLVHSLKTMAVEDNKTVVCTLHQPSSEIFELFDRLLFIADGEAIFFGRASEAVDYFASVGYSCGPHYNPSDFIMVWVFFFRISNSIFLFSMLYRFWYSSVSSILVPLFMYSEY